MKKIWIIEDTPLYQQTLYELIAESEGYECDMLFNNWEDAVRKLKNGVDAPDVILLDIGLKGESGVEGAAAIKSVHPRVHIIMFTVYEENEKIFNALRNGASGYLLKTSSADEILSAIEEVLNGGGPMSPVIAGKVLKMFQGLPHANEKYNLSEREREVLNALVQGMTKKEISETMFISYHTVDSHIRNIYDKLHVNSKSAAVAKAVKERLIN